MAVKPCIEGVSIKKSCVFSVNFWWISDTKQSFLSTPYFVRGVYLKELYHKLFLVFLFFFAWYSWWKILFGQKAIWKCSKHLNTQSILKIICRSLNSTGRHFLLRSNEKNFPYCVTIALLQQPKFIELCLRLLRRDNSNVWKQSNFESLCFILIIIIPLFC